jgi:hypothetical protein
MTLTRRPSARLGTTVWLQARRAQPGHPIMLMLIGRRAPESGTYGLFENVGGGAPLTTVRGGEVLVGPVALHVAFGGRVSACPAPAGGRQPG